MNKLVVKVAILTFLSLIAVSLISAFSIFTFAPGFAGDKCFELGLKNVATKCYERAYEQTGEFDDLVILVDNAIFSEDGDAVIEYGTKMINRNDEFSAFCIETDEKSEYVDYSSYDYYVTAVMMANYNAGKKTEAVDIAFSKLTADGYKEGIALFYAVQLAKEDEDLLQIILSSYKASTNRTFTNYKAFREELQGIDPEIKF